MTDLNTQAAELTAAFSAKRVAIFCTAGKKAVKFWKAPYLGCKSGHGISRGVALSYLR